MDLSHDGYITPSGSLMEYYPGKPEAIYGCVLGVNKNEFPRFSPIMGYGTGSVAQFSRGKYLGASNSEDDLNIIMNTPNSLLLRTDEQGADIDHAGSLVANNGNILGTGIIETNTDVDAWKFKTSGGNVLIEVYSNKAFPVLEPEAELIRVEDGQSFDLKFETTLPVGYAITPMMKQKYSGNLPAGNYVLKVSSGDYLNETWEEQGNYGSIGSYTIEGNIPGLSLFDATLQPLQVTLISPSQNSSSTSNCGDSLRIEFKIQVNSPINKAQINLNGTWRTLSPVAGQAGLYSYTLI